MVTLPWLAMFKSACIAQQKFSWLSFMAVRRHGRSPRQLHRGGNGARLDAHGRIDPRPGVASASNLSPKSATSDGDKNRSVGGGICPSRRFLVKSACIAEQDLSWLSFMTAVAVGRQSTLPGNQPQSATLHGSLGCKPPPACRVHSGTAMTHGRRSVEGYCRQATDLSLQKPPHTPGS